ncbi:BTAD domain-containing putative transcriptional regulator [Nonomuraea sp. NPDC000554]|uniref:BTAD domain-containing putative transcriptional regulator n=1 Tax=Nonomuraea sp. NPDC000554 TaxID=3154259 RepID=UPI003318FC73
MRFGVLGPLVAWTAGGEPVQVPEVKVRALLANLLAHRGAPVSADRLIDDLWGDRPPADALAALRVKVSQLRRVLGDRDAIVHRAPGYLLRATDDDVDADLFQSLLSRAQRTGDLQARRALLTEALGLWRGPAYAEFADHDFARPVTARLEEQRLVALEELAETRLALGEHGLMAAELTDLVAAHPLRERLRAVHIRALYRAGRQSEALTGYADLRERLSSELGLDPAPALTALHQAILEQDPALDAPAQRRTNLPAPLTPLIGRREAVAEVRSLLLEHRLVTLTGPGGVGKTRLALESAADPDRPFPGGTWLIELASTPPPGEPQHPTAQPRHPASDGLGGVSTRTDPPGRPGHPVSGGFGGVSPSTSAQVAEVVAEVLGVRDDVPGDRGERLAAVLRAGETLLVLDNCEHVVEQVAELAGRLLRAAPDLRILATSQEPLRVAGEALWSVPPLGREAAVELFTARAGVPPDDAVEEICARLDGIPLALELAATRTRLLTPRQLADRLDDRFRLLATGLRGVPARQQTLRAMIDWSWELLTGAERVVLRRLAVHADGCALEAAESVCAEPGLDVLDLLGRLVDRSLVVRVAGGRYRLLESVAAYCLERLAEAGELAAVRMRHVRYYADLAERAEPHLRGPGQRAWLALLDAESANLRTATETAVRLSTAGGTLKEAGTEPGEGAGARDAAGTGSGAADEAVRLVNALGWYWVLRGRLGEGQRALEAVLSVSGDVRAQVWLAGLRMLAGQGRAPDVRLFEAIGDPAARARAQWFLGFALFGYDDLATCDELVNGALDAFTALGDRWGTAAALSVRARLAMLRGDLKALQRDGEHGLELFRETGDRWGEMRAAENLGTLAEITGDYERAAELRRDGLRMAEELELWSSVPDALSRLGRIALLTGDHAGAEEFHERARRLAVAQSNRPAEEFAEIGLALGARRQGRLDEAERRLRDWLGWVRDVAGEPGAALILAELGFVAEQRGDAVAAQDLHLESLATARRVGDPRAIALALEGLAGVRALQDRHEEAALLLGRAAALRESVGVPLPQAERGDVDRVTVAVRSSLGEAALAAAIEAGGTIPLDDLAGAP